MPVYTPPDPVPAGFYRLNYGRMPAHTFGKPLNNPLLFQLSPENQVWVNPLVANEWSLKNGDYVRLGGTNGVVSNKVRIRVTERIGPDSVFMAHGFGHKSKRLRLAAGVGADDSELLKMAAEVAATHHEKWDGTGYPRGLKGEEIPMVGRIVAIADVFDALTSARPYKEAWSVDEAITYLQEQAGQHFDPALVDLFVAELPHILALREKFKE